MMAGKPPRLPMEYQEVEWLESTGMQYIDMNFNFENGFDFCVDAEIVNPQRQNLLFGVSAGGDWQKKSKEPS